MSIIRDVIKKSEIESSLLQYRTLNEEIKQLTEAKEKLKKALVKSYFENNPVYMNKDGSVTASYMSLEVTRLDSKLLHEEQPKIYDKYAYTQEEFRFTVSVKRGESS
jgi:predicted phage-related endonuclease